MSNPAAAATPGESTVRFLSTPRRMLIGGEWRDAVAGARLDVRNPATGEVITTVPASGKDDVNLAVAAARAAFESQEWGGARPVDRERWLLRLADLVEANAKELAELETLDNGKPLVISQRVDVPSA